MTRRQAPLPTRACHDARFLDATALDDRFADAGWRGAGLGMPEIDRAAAVYSAARWIVELHWNQDGTGARNSHGNAQYLSRLGHQFSGAPRPGGRQFADRTKQSARRACQRV